MKFLVFTFFLLSLSAFGDLKLPHIFSHGMVLQRETSSKIWGWAEPQASVTVDFKGRKLSTKARPNGRWEVEFRGLEATQEGAELTVKSGGEERVIENVVVGEVWLASGQSNMEWFLERTDGGKDEAASANDPLLRVFVTPNVARLTPQSDWKGEWKTTKPGESEKFPAVAYYFAKRLRAELQVPVAVIEAAWGGRSIASFMSHESLKQLPHEQKRVKDQVRFIQKMNWKVENRRHQEQLSEYRKIREAWEKDKKGKRPPRPDHRLKDPRSISSIYNGHIVPIIGYGIRGALWYQGESNAKGQSAHFYQETLEQLVAGWRKDWGDDFSFYWVQLANYKDEKRVTWHIIQDEMRRALKTIPRSGMAVINDIGDPDDIHPGNKLDVGERLARWALAKDYGKAGIIVSGPLYSGMKVKGSKIEVSFDYAVGLKSRDGAELGGFEIAGADGEWVAAKAEISQDKVIVFNESVDSPKSVRYAWEINPVGANLVNGEGLPTSCFTTEK